MNTWPPLMALAAGLSAALAHAQPAPPAPVTPVTPVSPVTPPGAATPPAPVVPPAAVRALPPLPPLPPEPGRTYAPGPFDRLELAGAARVIVVQGERDQAFVAGDAEVQKGVDVVLNDRQLVIRPAGGWKFWSNQKLFVHVEMRELRQLSVSGASDVHAPGPLRTDQLKLSISGAGVARLDQLQARQLSFSISGAGDGQLGGRVDELTLQISGKGKVVADRLQAQRARVSVSGIGNVVLWVMDDLNAHISGIGSVDYFGSPQVQRSVSGMGNINARGEKKPSVDSR
ncbi:head GIN domain-containing protein [Roseateles sp. BYS87W]|uniref:Head GIN domain-containing protein n=1 Tax=Pelomonas baiyunensis TaxID=3299026 RepID=A0ABW7GZJ7_9BURK